MCEIDTKGTGGTLIGFFLQILTTIRFCGTDGPGGDKSITKLSLLSSTAGRFGWQQKAMAEAVFLFDRQPQL